MCTIQNLKYACLSNSRYTYQTIRYYNILHTIYNTQCTTHNTQYTIHSVSEDNSMSVVLVWGNCKDLPMSIVSMIALRILVHIQYITVLAKSVNMTTSMFRKGRDLFQKSPMCLTFLDQPSLVGGFNPSKKYLSDGTILFPIYGKS